MYASPLRDDGYDISDFYAIHPSYGTVEDFQKFLDAAHARDLRVITDLVMNHTSDQHPWFQASRSDPASPYGDYYVWNASDRRYADARVIFVDTENPTGRSIPYAASTTGTASSATSPTSTTTTPRSAARCSTSCASGSIGASTASAATRCPTSWSARGRAARTCRRRTRSSRSSGR